MPVWLARLTLSLVVGRDHDRLLNRVLPPSSRSDVGVGGLGDRGSLDVLVFVVHDALQVAFWVSVGLGAADIVRARQGRRR